MIPNVAELSTNMYLLSQVWQIAQPPLEHIYRQGRQPLLYLLVLRLAARLRDLAVKDDLSAVDLLLADPPARRGERRGPAPLVHRVRHRGPHQRHPGLGHVPVRLDGLPRLVRRHGAWPGGEAQLPCELAPVQRPHEQHLRQLGPALQHRGAGVGVDPGEGAEQLPGAAARHPAVQLRRLQHEAAVGRPRVGAGTSVMAGWNCARAVACMWRSRSRRRVSRRACRRPGPR